METSQDLTYLGSITFRLMNSTIEVFSLAFNKALANSIVIQIEYWCTAEY